MSSSSVFEKILKAARDGDAQKQLDLGIFYKDGFSEIGIPQDPKKALFWFETAAAQGDPNALTVLGSDFHDGDGVASAKDLERALRYYQLHHTLYEDGNSEIAMESVEAELDEPKNRWSLLQTTKDEDDNPDFSELLEDALSGDSDKQVELACAYKNGRKSLSVLKNWPKALDWFRQAAAQHNLRALDYLGRIYQNGECGLEQNKVLAKCYWNKKKKKEKEAEAREESGESDDDDDNDKRHSATRNSFSKPAAGEEVQSEEEEGEEDKPTSKQMEHSTVRNRTSAAAGVLLQDESDDEEEKKQAPKRTQQRSADALYSCLGSSSSSEDEAEEEERPRHNPARGVAAPASVPQVRKRPLALTYTPPEERNSKTPRHSTPREGEAKERESEPLRRSSMTRVTSEQKKKNKPIKKFTPSSLRHLKPEELYAHGIAFRDGNRPDLGIDFKSENLSRFCLEEAAWGGDKDAQIDAARCFRKGTDGFKQDDDKAFVLYKMAAHAGSSRGMYYCGIYCQRWFQFEEAYKWYQDALDHGFSADDRALRRRMATIHPKIYQQKVAKVQRK